MERSKRRSFRDIRGVTDIKSARSIGARSMPKTQTSSYLDLYVIIREKEMLAKELSALEKRKKAIENRLTLLSKRIKDLQKEEPGEEKAEAEKGRTVKPLKTMAIRY